MESYLAICLWQMVDVRKKKKTFPSALCNFIFLRSRLIST